VGGNCGTEPVHHCVSDNVRRWIMGRNGMNLTIRPLVRGKPVVKLLKEETPYCVSATGYFKVTLLTDDHEKVLVAFSRDTIWLPPFVCQYTMMIENYEQMPYDVYISEA
jgi:hypothetical protein